MRHDGSKMVCRGRRRTPRPEEVTPEPWVESNVRDGRKARKPRRVGGLERGKPIPLAAIPWRVAVVSAFASERAKTHEGSCGENRGTSMEGNTLEGRKPKKATCRVSV